MGGFKESLNDLEIYRLQSNSGQSIQNSTFSNSEGRTSLFERKYLAKRQREKQQSISESNLIQEEISTGKPNDQKLPASGGFLFYVGHAFHS